MHSSKLDKSQRIKQSRQEPTYVQTIKECSMPAWKTCYGNTSNNEVEQPKKQKKAISDNMFWQEGGADEGVGWDFADGSDAVIHQESMSDSFEKCKQKKSRALTNLSWNCFWRN